MKPVSVVALALVVALLALPGPASAQLTSGNLYGTIVDEQGSALPGGTLTLTGQGDPHVFVTDAQGRFRFLGLAPGRYELSAQLEGFSTVDYPNIVINVGRNTEIEITLGSAVEDVITVTPESPLLDERRIATGQTVSQTELEKIPTARDPWVILQQTPGVLMDRINVGGNEAGQQSQLVSPGAGGEFTGDAMEAFAKVLAGQDLVEPKGGGSFTYTDLSGKQVTILVPEGWDAGQPPPDPPADVSPPPDVPPGVNFDNFWLATPRWGRYDRGQAANPNSVWSVDGVVISDMSALGSSPSYYDFESFEEMQVTTGGNDATIVTPGVVLNMVTKRGTNELRGSGRYFISDSDWQAAEEDFQAGNQTFQQGGRLVEVQDFGAELGGPIVKDRLWIWGSHGAQEVDRIGDPDAAPAGQGWDWNTLREISKKLTVDANGNDATSPAFDPSKIVQFGYPLNCDIPGYDVITPSPLQGPDACPQIESSIRSFFGTGTFQGFLPDPFAEPKIHVGAGEPPTGRVGSIAVDPSDPTGNTVYSTGATGGTWKTTNFLTTDPAGPTWVPLTETTWNQSRFGDAPTAFKLEDTHIFSSDFYLTGLYSYVDGGFQLVPQGGGFGAHLDPIPPQGGLGEDLRNRELELFFGYAPGAGGLVPGSPGGTDPATDATGPRTAFVLDRDDFTLCPNGMWLGRFGLGDPVGIGNGSTFQPLVPVDPECEGFEWDTIVPRIGLTYALGQERKTLLRASYSRFADQLGTSVPPPGTWFMGATAAEEENKPEEDLFLQDRIRFGDYFSLNLGVRVDAFEDSRQPREDDIPPFDSMVFNPASLSGLPTIPDDQGFGGRFRIRGLGGRVIRESALEQRGPGGSTAVDGAEDDVPTILLVSLGESTGEAFRAHVLSDRPVTIEGIAVLEPVAMPADEVERLEERMEEAGAATVAIEAYCFQFDGLVPNPGTVYRFAPPEVQRAFEPLARVLDAGQRIKDAGGLVPDTQLETYFPAISQWAVWTREKGFDLDAFGEAWLGHVKKNVEQAGDQMTEELEKAVRDRIPGRWQDIQKILAEADRVAGGATPP